MTELKSRLSREEIAGISLRLAERLFKLPEYDNADTIFTYLSFNQEVRTAPLIERALKDGKKVAVPRIEQLDENGRKLPLFEQKMDFVYVDENTVYGMKMGIREPLNGIIADCDALVIMPGLAFGRDMNRIGTGGGFYDRYFADHPDREYIKVALCYDFQVFDTLPSEEHDIRIDILITPESVQYNP